MTVPATGGGTDPLVAPPGAPGIQAVVRLSEGGRCGDLQPRAARPAITHLPDVRIALEAPLGRVHSIAMASCRNSHHTSMPIFWPGFFMPRTNTREWGMSRSAQVIRMISSWGRVENSARAMILCMGAEMRGRCHNPDRGAVGRLELEHPCDWRFS